jgi:hypothetical protein
MTMEVAIEALITGLDGLRLAGDVAWDLENLPALAPTSVPIAWNARVAWPRTPAR